jgi:hypothetical protein
MLSQALRVDLCGERVLGGKGSNGGQSGAGKE